MNRLLSTAARQITRSTISSPTPTPTVFSSLLTSSRSFSADSHDSHAHDDDHHGYTFSKVNMHAKPSEPQLPPMTVADVSIQVTFVDHSGSRVTIPCRIGQTMYAAATLHGIDLGPISAGAIEQRVHSETWTEDLYGEGPNSAFDHVMIPNQWLEVVGEAGNQERMMLDQAWEEDEVKPSSRLASMVTLTREMDGMSVFIPDGLPEA